MCPCLSWRDQWWGRRRGCGRGVGHVSDSCLKWYSYHLLPRAVSVFPTCVCLRFGRVCPISLGLSAFVNMLLAELLNESSFDAPLLCHLKCRRLHAKRPCHAPSESSCHPPASRLPASPGGMQVLAISMRLSGSCARLLGPLLLRFRHPPLCHWLCLRSAAVSRASPAAARVFAIALTQLPLLQSCVALAPSLLPLHLLPPYSCLGRCPCCCLCCCSRSRPRSRACLCPDLARRSQRLLQESQHQQQQSQ